MLTPLQLKQALLDLTTHGKVAGLYPAMLSPTCVQKNDEHIVPDGAGTTRELDSDCTPAPEHFYRSRASSLSFDHRLTTYSSESHKRLVEHDH